MKNDFEEIMKKSNPLFLKRIREIIIIINEELSVMNTLVKNLKEDYSNYKIRIAKKNRQHRKN